MFLTEIAPKWLRGPVGTAVELLAGIPSIIYGMWGLFVLVPVLAEHVYPWIDSHLGQWPVVGALFSGPPLGLGMLTAGLVLAVMVIPFIASVMRDVFLTVPRSIEGIVVCAGLHALGSGLGRGASVYALGGDRRHLPGTRPRAGRDHGRDLRARQRA
jgi:ABC-type phosphate transport system permease subunit